MYSLKKLFSRGLLLAECVVFAAFYIGGTRGLPLLRALRAENKLCVQDIMLLESEINQLQSDIDEWHAYPFYKEKVAREELQLINPGDTVYLVK